MAEEPSNLEQPTLWVVVENHQTKLFSVFGPVGEDSEWASKVRLTRQQGMDVTFSTVASKADVKLTTSALATHGYRWSIVPVL